MIYMDKNENGRTKKLSALDVFVIVLACLAAAGLVVRVAVGRGGALPEDAPVKGEYALTFEISSMKASGGSELVSGDVMYTESGEVFGTVSGRLSVTPAKIYTEDADGKYVLSYSNGEGDSAAVDVKGVIKTEGYKTDYGFLVGGRIFASPGYEITLHTDKLTASVKVIDIAKVTD